MKTLRNVAWGAVLASSLVASASAQGILTVTPGRSISTTSGNGTLAYTGDGGQAGNATIAEPNAVTYDAAGDLFVADTRNHVIREITKAGVITTVAGSGVQGFGGDNGPATSALLDTPTSVAVDGSGNLYIADSHNHRIRKVTAGTITTIAGTGIAGFSGDGAPATLAQLADPTAVALDSTGNLYIADTHNQRIRKVTAGTITTVAGDGEQLFQGDGTPATSASLDTPTGVAVDRVGNVLIADRHNHRIRFVQGNGAMGTAAGSGAVSFAGGFSGDGGNPLSATLAKPTGVSVDAAGNIYIADTNNHRIREYSGGTVATIVGSTQGFGGDGGLATGGILNAPKSSAVDSLGNVAIADRLNERIRLGQLPTVTFTPSQNVGIPSAAQPVTLANSGSAPITVQAATFSGTFGVATGGTCGALPITLAAGASCTQNITYIPTTVGATAGSVVFSGSGVVSQTILLAGTGIQTSTTTTLTSSLTQPFVGQFVTFTATVTPVGLGSPTGTVSFYDGTTLLATVTVTNGVATFTTSSLSAGSHSITAVYSGDVNFVTSSSSPLVQGVSDFNFVITSNTNDPNASPTETVVPGKAAIFSFNVSPVAGPFTIPIVLSATGLPAGASVVFSPATLTLGAASASFTMTIQTPATAQLRDRRIGAFGTTIAFGLLLLPFSRRMRRGSRKLGVLKLSMLAVVSMAAIGGLSGCGTGTGFFGQPQASYNINVIGTATSTTGAVLQHSLGVVVVVE